MQPPSKYTPRVTTGFYCPSCGRAILPMHRLSYPPDAIGKFAPVYRCGCGRHVGEPVGMMQLSKRS
jgi:hypothetical protein